jgi:uncharacterized membrane protein
MPFNLSGGEFLRIILVYGGSTLIIVLLIILGVRYFNRKGRNNAIDIARQRYAKGELSQAEFEKIKNNID